MPIEPNILIQMLKSRSEYERLGAAQELAKVAASAPAIVQALQRSAQNDASERVRQAAKAALSAPAQQAVLRRMPASAAVLAAPARPRSRYLTVLGNTMARFVIFSLLVVGVGIWVVLLNGFSLTGLLLVLHLLLASSSLFLWVRWLDQAGRRDQDGQWAYLVFRSVFALQAVLAGVMWLASTPVVSLGVLVGDAVYLAGIAAEWRSGERK